MPPDPCDIDSFSGSHATGLGSASISFFSPIFSNSVLEIPSQFPSPPAHAPRASVRPSVSVIPSTQCCSLSVPHFPCRWDCKLTCVCSVCVCLWKADPSIKKGVWVNQTGQELRWRGFHQTWSPYICLFSIVLSHLFCSPTGLLDNEVRGAPWTPHLYAYPSVVVIALKPTFNKTCSWNSSMANIKRCEAVKLPMNGKIQM